MKKLHAFVTMPCGKKTGPEGIAIGFNADYSLHNGLPKPSTLKKDQATLAFLHNRKITNKIINILAVNAYSP